MVIKSAKALHSDYDGMVMLSREKQEPIFLTRNGEGEMVFTTIGFWEKREGELALIAALLRRGQNKQAGAQTSSMEDMRALVGKVLYKE